MALTVFLTSCFSLGTGVDGESEDWWRTKFVKCQPLIKDVGKLPSISVSR